MKITHSLPVVAAALLALGPTMGAQGSSSQSQSQSPPTSQAKPDAKPESKAPASIAGKWNLTVDTQGGTRDAVLDVKLDGKKVSGTLGSTQGEAAIEGEFADGKLTFSMVFQTSNGPLNIVFSGSQKEDGTLAGTMDFGGGQGATWTAVRPKQ